jgi:hypothetical protein
MNIHIQISMIASIGLFITYIHFINSLLNFFFIIIISITITICKVDNILFNTYIIQVLFCFGDF